MCSSHCVFYLSDICLKSRQQHKSKSCYADFMYFIPSGAAEVTPASRAHAPTANTKLCSLRCLDGWDANCNSPPPTHNVEQYQNANELVWLCSKELEWNVSSYPIHPGSHESVSSEPATEHLTEQRTREDTGYLFSEVTSHGEVPGWNLLRSRVIQRDGRCRHGDSDPLNRPTKQNEKQ